MDNKQFAGSLHELAKFYEEHPDFPQFDTYIFNVWLKDKETFQKAARELGDSKKGAVSDYFFLKRQFGPFRLDVNVQRDLICEKRQVGTRTIPAYSSPEQVVPVYEWTCPESVMKGGE